MRAPNHNRNAFFSNAITEFLREAECGKAQVEFLRQLHDDPRVDEVWSALVEKKPELLRDDKAPFEFLDYLATVWEIIFEARYQAVQNKMQRLDRILLTRLKKYWAKRYVSSPSYELPAILKEMEQLAKDELEKDSNPPYVEPISSAFPELDIRSDHGGLRLRTAFIRFISQWTRRVTGEWGDGEVATLTEIAFPDDGDVTLDAVRSARRAFRPAT